MATPFSSPSSSEDHGHALFLAAAKGSPAAPGVKPPLHMVEKPKAAKPKAPAKAKPKAKLAPKKIPPKKVGAKAPTPALDAELLAALEKVPPLQGRS